MGGKIKVLVVDDDRRMTKTLCDILRARGYQTLAAENGREGLALIGRNPVNLALIDLGLPDISGLDVLKRIRADYPHTETIILTGNATLDSAIEATNKGAFSYLQKPYEVDQLLLHVRHAIEKQQSEETIREYQEHLEELVTERTAELEKEIVAHQRAEEKIARLNEDLQQQIVQLETTGILAEAGVKARGEFLANTTHELVTPLNSIIGFSQIMLDGLGGALNDKQREYLQAILQGGERLNEAYSEILQVAGLESGEMQLQVHRFLFKDLLQSSLQALHEKAVVQGVTLALEIGPLPETEIEADLGKLRQVMFNLLDNAVKFTPAGGSVCVSARLTEDEAVGAAILVSVADTGIGIKNEDMARLFKPFQQLEPIDTKKYKGTGLGLLLARKLVELHGGRIRVESEFGKGSTFTFVLPVRQSRVSRSGAEQTESNDQWEVFPCRQKYS